MLKRIERVAKTQGLTDQEAFDTAFHMLDWLDDLHAFAQFCENPGSYTDEQLHEMLTGFLIHVPNHVAAAAKLYTGSGVKDIFGVGALDADE